MRFVECHPYWFVAILEIIVIAVYLIAGTIASVAQLSNQAIAGMANTTLSVLVIGALSALGWWRAVGCRRPAHPRDLLFFLPPVIPVLLNLVVGLSIPSLFLFLELLALACLIGFAEEAIFRGLMLNALKARGLWQAAIITALLFGLSHSLNLLSGKSGAAILIQVAYALAVGFAFAAVVLKKGILWPLVIAHTLIDFTSFIGRDDFPDSWNTIAGVALTCMFMWYGLYLMWQKDDVPMDCAADLPNESAAQSRAWQDGIG
ncbi:CPBP family intramembrane metalloprotease [Chloroflexales bacterium ZM16-3]|nr:CPBP family intramembrane metalloprotease [Chloroflexales bacterium ZM16-3]